MTGCSPSFLALGPLEVRVDGRAVDLGSPKQRGVLGVLLASAPGAVTVERLTDELWPDEPPGDPVRSLQVYVSSLRRTLAPHGELLLTEGRAYRLEVPDGAFDVALFEDEAARAARLLAGGEPLAASELARGALDRWRGAAWQDLRALPGIGPLAVRLDELRLDVASVRVEARLALGEHRELVPALEEVVAAHPLREDLRAHLMVALHRTDRQVEALDVYATGRALKVEETGLEPGRALQALHAEILADDPALLVEDAELRGRRHLPAQVTRLVGRDQLVGELVAELRDPGCRLLTLTGTGGIGKTRVGLQVAHELARDFPDGVWFVALDSVRDHRLVAQTVAEVLGVAESGDDFVEPLCAHLADRRLLLLVDNFEQVADAAPLVSRLLAAGPGSRVLVTSRTRLGLYGERVRTVDPLAREAAVPLFVERARAAEHRFDAGATRQVALVCEALDRLPLALELVAARADQVPLPDMLAQLGSRLDLADRGPVDRSVRQQTLRHAIGWSVDLLPPDLARVFGRLGVFVGGFDAAAAEAVAGAAQADLDELERASLLVAEPTRFRLLETVRAFACEIGGAEREAAASRHAEWFLGLAEQSVLGFRGPEAGAWQARLQAERGNMRTALEHLACCAPAEEPPGTRLLRLAGALSLFWYRTSPASEDVEWIGRALEAAPGADEALRGRAWHGLAICRGEQGRAEEAVEHSRRSYLLLRDGDDPAWTARALNTLAGLTRDLGRAEEAARMMEESIALRRRLDDPSLPVSLALANRAMAALDLGDLDRARECLEECLLEDGADALDRALVLVGLADVAVEAGDTDEAVELLRAAVPVVRREALSYRAVECLDTLAALACRRGLLLDAVRLVAAADRAMADDGAVQVPADAALRTRRVGRFVADLDPAERQRAEEQGWALELDAAMAHAIDRLL